MTDNSTARDDTGMGGWRDMGEREFAPAELHMISQIMKAEKTLPDEMWAVAAVQELACLLVIIEPLLLDKHMATLIGIGAFVARQGKLEMTADIQAGMALNRARNRP